MTVDKATQTITKVITNTLEEYDQSADSKATDAQGVVTRIPHALDIIDAQDQLFALDMALKDVALKATPISLIETTGSTASELKRISTDYFIRVPVEPTAGTNLDIDDGLSYAVVYKALGLLWREYGDYEQRADSIVNTYIQAYRDYLIDLVAGVVGAGAETYVRFSADGVAWHDSFTTGDIYISFKKIETATWTPAIQFVGRNGIDGTDGTNFNDALTYTGNGGKIVAVNSQGTDLELIPAPTSGVAGANVFGDKVFFDDANGGTLNLDASTNNVFYLYPPSNAELHFSNILSGTTYTFMLVSSGAVAITFDPAQSILGDATVGLGSSSATTGITMTMLKMVYSGYDWYVVSKNVITDANG